MRNCNGFYANLAPLHGDFLRRMFQHLNFFKRKIEKQQFHVSFCNNIRSVFFSYFISCKFLFLDTSLEIRIYQFEMLICSKNGKNVNKTHVTEKTYD